MYDNEVPEQLIKEIMGHKSNCIKVYKWTSDHLKEDSSKKVSGEPIPKVSKVELEDPSRSDSEEHDDNFGKLSFEKMVKNVTRTKLEMQKKLYPKSRLKAKRIVQWACKFTIDLNLNMKFNK